MRLSIYSCHYSWNFQFPTIPAPHAVKNSTRLRQLWNQVSDRHLKFFRNLVTDRISSRLKEAALFKNIEEVMFFFVLRVLCVLCRTKIHFLAIILGGSPTIHSSDCNQPLPCWSPSEKEILVSTKSVSMRGICSPVCWWLHAWVEQSTKTKSWLRWLHQKGTPANSGSLKRSRVCWKRNIANIVQNVSSISTISFSQLCFHCVSSINTLAITCKDSTGIMPLSSFPHNLKSQVYNRCICYNHPGQNGTSTQKSKAYP